MGGMNATYGSHDIMNYFLMSNKDTLYHAIKNNNSKIIAAWLKCDIKICQRKFDAALLEGASNNELNIITQLLSYDVSTVIGALLRGSILGHSESVATSLQHHNNDQKWTLIKNVALQFSVRNNHLDIATKLLENGADACTNGNYALITSVQMENFEMMVKLLENGANVHAHDDEALSSGVDARRLDIVTKLLECGVNARARNDFIFLRSFWPKNVMSSFGECLIMHSRRTMTRADSDLKIISALLEYGGDICCCNKLLLKKIRHEFNKELAVVIFPYCTSDDYHYFPDWFVEEAFVQTKNAAKI